MTKFEKWLKEAREQAEDDMLKLGITRKALRMLEVAVKELGDSLASSADVALDKINQIAKEKE